MSRSPLSFLAAPLLLAPALGGCAATADFPSLAPRPIEKALREEAQEPAAPAEAAADPALKQQLDRIVASGEAGHRAFLAELGNGRPAIARAGGSAAGGEAWVAGQQAYSAIDAARGGLLAAMADLDALRRARSGSASPADQAAMDASAQRLSTIEAEESQAVAELSAKLG